MADKQQKTKFFDTYKGRFFALYWSIAAKSLLVGLIAGVLVAVYRVVIEGAGSLSMAVIDQAKSNPVLIIGIIIAALVASFIVAKLIAWEPMAKASGVPQTEGVLSSVLKMRWWSVLIVRYIGGFLSALFGLSLGRAGPSVQIGAAAGELVRSASKRGGIEGNCLTTAGAAAGLSAVFSAPLSGIVFTLEEVHRSFSPLLLIAAATGAIAAGSVAGFAFGLHPTLWFTEVPEIAFGSYVWMVPLGIFCGLLGAVTNRLLLAASKVMGKIPAWLRPATSMILAIPVVMYFPMCTGGGENLIGTTETVAVGLGMLVALLVVKLLFTCVSFGGGTPGGLFMPTLAIGALGGAVFCGVLAQFGVVPTSYMVEFAVCGMAATFAGVAKAPMTGIMLAVELTGSLSYMLPVTIAAFTALFIADVLRTEPIYNTLLSDYIDVHGKQDNEDDPDRLFEVVVQKGSALDGAQVSKVDWPATSILISIHKAWRTVGPRATTRIRYDDGIIASPVGDRDRAKCDLEALAYSDEPQSDYDVRCLK